MSNAFSSIVQQVRERTDIVELIGRYVSLKRAGSSFKACCPFHQEKTPSFHVNPTRQFYYCFGCGAKGDVFTFLTEYDGIRFPEALRQLADAAGIELPDNREQQQAISDAQQRKELLYQINQWAAEFFVAQRKLPEHGHLRDYIEKRRIAPEIVERFQLGYAPDDWGMLTQWFRDRGTEQTLVEEAGLIKKAEKSDRRYDRFRHRLMFPIYLPSGRLAGFGGRALRGDDGAKYLNSPESPIFQKGTLLYGLDQAHTSIRRSKRAILVEGYMDVIVMHQYGFQDAVATLGTSLTIDHVALLKRYAQRLVLLFDGDKAGFRAVERALAILLPAGFAADVLMLPKGEDPDSFLLKHGREAMETHLQDEAKPALDFWLGALRDDAAEDPIRLREATQKLLDVLREVTDPILQGLYIQKVASFFGVEESELRRQLLRVVPAHSKPVQREARHSTQEAPAALPSPAQKPTIKTLSREQEIMVTLLKIVIENPDRLSSVSDAEVGDILQDAMWQNVWLRFEQDAFEDAEAPILIQGVLDALEDYPSLQERLADRLMKVPPFEAETLDEALSDCIQRLHEQHLDQKIRDTQQALSEAAALDDEESYALQVQLAQLKVEYTRQRIERWDAAPRITAPLLSMPEDAMS